MRPIDFYRGKNPPCHQFDPFFNPEYQKALAEVGKAEKILRDYGVPTEMIEQYDTAQNHLTATELDLMWCFAFAAGMEFQRNLTTDIAHCDVSVFMPEIVDRKKHQTE